ncbi:MAG TPA: methylenetetrahydrofolate reductase [Propioniciclava tarda]|nr:methylenetetrahydrofolate reductase [Propioniciclava tarda]HQA29795.1 methylenetetrahydrofolate reductase [Propioniciclava tarda]HQD59788.1 methylenetetrahydrofolate reductase [Propioniciclava tarda]
MTSQTIAQRLGEPDRPTFSFEFFPPSDAAGAFVLLDTVVNLRELRPDWVSVTYGATGATRERTFDAVRAIQRHGGVQTMGHLTVSGQTRDEVAAALASYAELGVKHILAIRGDMPAGPLTPFEAHPDGLGNATELVRLVKASGDFEVGVAAFADGHPAQFDLDLDARLLLDKQEAGASFAVTQMVFRADSYLALVERFRALGGTIPIVAGIMPVTNLGQIARFKAMAGDVMPDDLVAELMTAAADKARFREIGLERITRLCDQLLAGGAPGLQFFTLNRSTATNEIVARLRQIPPHRA